MLALTPIRVRGRRKNPPVKKAKHYHGRKGGRPLMTRQARLHSSQSRNISRARLWVARAARKPRQSRSRLEALPVEILEKIFLYSLNVNLPRSSPALAAAVSSERIYRVLVLLAFWNDSTAEAAEVPDSAIARILRPLEYVPLQDDERDDFQASILGCRWCTMPRLLRYVPDMTNLTIQRYWVNAGITMAQDQITTLDRFLARSNNTCTYEGTDAHSKNYTLSITPFVSITITCRETDEQQTHKIFKITQFPERLLRGSDDGFTEEHMLSLETLRLACGLNRSDHLETNITIARDALHDGIHRALIENNLNALAALLKIDEYVFRSAAAIADLQPYTLPAEHFRTAVRLARYDPTPFQQLLRASAESVPADDPEITEWAMQLGGAFGPWLLDLMMHLPQQIEAAHANPTEAALFYLGRANGQIGLASRYLREVLGVEELDSWMESSPVDVTSLWMVGDGKD